jgi:hypothetical protein
MRCSTLLCGAPAEYIHRGTKEKKCSRCKNKRGDRHSLVWESLEEDEESIHIPPFFPIDEYKIFESNNGKYIVCDNSEERRVVCGTREEAIKIAQALNTAFKLGAESVLHNLSGFSLDQRRKFGIVWGEKCNSINS